MRLHLLADFYQNYDQIQIHPGFFVISQTILCVIQNEARMKQLEYAKQAVSQEKSKPHPSPRKLHPEDIQQISGRQLVRLI